MIKVQVEGKGIVEFPDGTSPEIIDRTIKRDFFPEKLAKEKPTFMSKYLPSVKRVPEIYQEEIQTNVGRMKKTLEEPTGRNIISGLLGVPGYILSPLTAVTKGMIEEPITQVSGKILPKSIAQFLGEMAGMAPYMVPYGQLVKQAMNVPKMIEGISKTTKSIKPIEKIAERAPKEPLSFPEEIAGDVIADLTKPISQTQKAVLREDVVGDVIKAVKEPVSGIWEATGKKRITQEVIDYLMVYKNKVPKILEKYQLTPEQFAVHMKETMSTSGRQLGQMGRWAKEIIAEFKSPQMKELANFMEKDLPEVQTLDRVMDIAKKVENVRRAGLVSQFATTARNIISQTGRLTIGSIDEAFQGAIKGALGEKGIVNSFAQGGKETFKGLGEGLDAWTAMANRLRPSKRKALTNLLEQDAAIKAKSVLYGAPIQDVTLTNKIAKTLNVFNTAQEFFFRNIAFEAKLNQLLRQGGIKGGIKGIKPQEIPDAMFNKSADYALEMTFAAMPKSKFGKDWVRFNTNPIMTALLNPFPRFLWGNAIPFLKNFSPISFLEAVNPKVVAELASGNPERFAKAASQATLGTIMLNTAAKIRSDPSLGGENWWEIRMGKNKTLDTRAFAPFSSYLFLAESMVNPEKIVPADFAQAVLSLNRIAGTGLVLTDIIRGKKAETVVNTLSRIGGAYLGSFSVPARTVKDIYARFDPNEAIIRDVRGQEIVGPFKANIPEISQKLPAARSPLKSEPLKTETPVFRQFTGLAIKTKKMIEQEVDKLGLDSSAYMPRTGIPEADRLISSYMGPKVEKTVSFLLNNPIYQKVSEPMKRIFLREYFKEIRKEAQKKLEKEYPQLAIKTKLKRQPEDVKTILRNTPIQQFMK